VVAVPAGRGHGADKDDDHAAADQRAHTGAAGPGVVEMGSG
jgi:hypothetical protein